jgi:hypothetical protein
VSEKEGKKGNDAECVDRKREIEKDQNAPESKQERKLTWCNSMEGRRVRKDKKRRS